MSKIKQYHLSDIQLSELSYISQERTSFLEIANFWEKRLEHFCNGVRKSLAIPEDYEVNWNDAFKNKVITATPPVEVKKEEVKVESKGEDHALNIN
jgi:hypothetical protein